MHINVVRHAAVANECAQCGEQAERGIIGGFVSAFLPNIVGAPFPLAGRAGGWVGQRSDFIIDSFCFDPLALQSGNLNASPLLSTAQVMRAFFAAIATTAFQ